MTTNALVANIRWKKKDKIINAIPSSSSEFINKVMNALPTEEEWDKTFKTCEEELTKRGIEWHLD